MIPKMLLLLEESVEEGLLLWRQCFPEFGLGSQQFLMELRRNRFHESARTFLTLFQDLVDVLSLIYRQVEVALYPA
jgi:hypothetical protein